MAKKTTKKKSAPTFQVRFVAPELSPEKIPLRAVSDALAAIQDLASGRDPIEMQRVPPNKGIGLVDVRQGSAVYYCVSRAPAEALRNLNRIADLLRGDSKKAHKDDLIASALRPIKSLSDIAKSVGCTLEVVIGAQAKAEPLFAVEQADYERLSQRILLSGETTIVGTVVRVGGATGLRCLMRLPGRRRLLYCGVRGRDLARRLGQKLYEDIAVSGTATWIRHTWRIHAFTIRDFAQPRLGSVDKAISDLREAGLNAWDEIEKPEQFVRGLR